MNKLGVFLLTLVLAISVSLIAATGCAGGEPKTVTTTTTVTETATTISITDDLGREVTIEGIPSRIVSLAPSNTEIIYALGLGDNLVGVTELCNYPEEAMEKEKVGAYDNVDIEKIIAINPDLILAEDMHKVEVIPALGRFGFDVVALVPHNLQEVMDSIILIGRITGTEEKALQIVDDMSKKIKAITDETDKINQAEKPKVLYVIWHEPIMSVGSDTRIHELIEKAGGVNIAAVAGEGYPTLTLEEIINTNPQVIMVNDDISLQFILNESRLAVVDAFINGQIYGINADLTNRPTPRIVKALELMAKMIHPEIFGAAE